MDAIVARVLEPQLQGIFFEEEACGWFLEQKPKERKSDSDSVDVDGAGGGALFGHSLSPPAHTSWYRTLWPQLRPCAHCWDISQLSNSYEND